MKRTFFNLFFVLLLSAGTAYSQVTAPEKVTVNDMTITSGWDVVTTYSGWIILSNPVPGATIDDLLGDYWTQGFPGSDAPEGEFCNVYFYEESASGDKDKYGWVVPESQNQVIPPGSGIFWYAYEDDTPFDKTDPLPTSRRIGVEGDPVANSFFSEFDFSNKLSFTKSGHQADLINDGWIMLGNPSKSIMLWGVRGWLNRWVHNPKLSFNAYVLNQRTQTYTVMSHNDYIWPFSNAIIGPYQGFWVQVTGDISGNSGKNLLKLGAGSIIDLSWLFNLSLKAEADEENTAPPIHEARFVLNEADTVFSNEFTFRFEADAQLGLDYLDAYDLGSYEYNPIAFTRFEAEADTLNGLPIETNYLPEGITNTERRYPVIVRYYDNQEFTLDIKNDSLSIPEHVDIFFETLDGQQIRVDDNFHLDLSLNQPSEKSAKRLANPHPSTLMSSDDGQLIGYVVVQWGNMTSVDDFIDTPTSFELEQNYPNPFNPSTTINYSLSEASTVRLDVFNMAGQKISTLVNTKQAAGNHAVSFDASNLTSGVYFYRLNVGNRQITKKMTLVK